MPIINESLLSPAMQFTVPPGARPDEWVRMTVADYPDLPWMMAGNINGAKTGNAVIGYSAPDGSGAILTSFFDYFYNRIHITPSVLELGNITANTSAEVEVWNAYLTDKNVTSDSFSNDSGVEVTGQSAPYTLPPLGFEVYDVTVLEDGPATIQLSLGWVIDGSIYGFEVSASRIIPFFYPPNWSRNVTENLEWRTSIGSSFSGEEQRQQIRSKPRRSWSYNVLLKGDNARNVYFDILGFQNKTFGLPVWHDKVKLLSPVSPGATVISVNTSGYGFEVDSIVFIHHEGLVETHEIASFTSTTITLQKALSNSFPTGSEVYPGAVVQLPQSFSFRRLTDGVLEGQITFNGVPQNTPVFIPSVAASETLDGFEVIQKKPNWAGGIETIFEYPVDEIDYLTGIKLRGVTRDYPATMYRLKYLLRNRSEIELFRALLGRLSGRFTPVFVNIFTDDFKLSGTISSGGTGFQIIDNHSDLGLFPARHPIAVSFETTNGSIITRRVSTVAINQSGLIDVQITSPTGVLITESNLKRITVCPLCRLASDQIVFNWVTNSVVEVELTFQVVSR